MVPWLFRGVVMTAVHVLTRVVLGIAVIHAPLHSTVWKTLAIAFVVLVALLWGGFDGVRDAQAHPDTDDYADLTVRWLKAGLLAGVAAGIICWILGKTVFAGIGEAGLVVEIFAGGSFTALLVLTPAFVGAAVGRWLVRRDQNKNGGDDWSVHPERDETGRRVDSGDPSAPTEQLPVQRG